MPISRLTLHGLFIFVGVATTMLGPLLPSLMKRWALSDSEAGALFTAQYFLAVSSSVLVLFLIGRLRTWRLMVLGYLLCGVGSMGLAGPTALFGFVGACLYGFGLGLVNPTANLSAAALMPGNSSAAINLLNFFFSVGATFTPAVIGAFVDAGWSQWFPLCVALPMLLGAMLALPMPVSDFQPSGALETEKELAKTVGNPRNRQSRFALCAMALLFVYVGVEVGMGGWTSTYLLRVSGADPVLAASAPAALWGAVLVSRLIAVYLLRFLSVATILACSIAISLLGSVLLLLFPSPWTAIGAIAFTGLGLGPIFANGLGYFLEHYGRGADRLSGLLFAAGGVGGGLLPYLIGRFSDASGDLRLALWSVPCCGVLMLVVLWATVRFRPDRTGNLPRATKADQS